MWGPPTQTDTTFLHEYFHGLPLLADEGASVLHDEWLVLSNGVLYRQEFTIGQLEKQQGVATQDLDTVDEVLFDRSKRWP
jgi:hypothetical protein